MAALADLRDRGASGANGLGDPPPMPPEVSDWTRPMVEARFGAGFAASVFEAQPGGWSGPVASAYGYHLVLVSNPRPPTSRTSPRWPAGSRPTWTRRAAREHWTASTRT